MTTELQPNGQPVEEGGVQIWSPGLRGLVDVYRDTSVRTRAAEAATDALISAIDASDMTEQVTVVIHGHSIDPTTARSAPTRRTARREPGLSVRVPAPGTGRGQVLLAKDEVGTLRWILADDVPPAESVTRGDEARTYTIPLDVAPESSYTMASRGLIGAVGKKVLKVLTFKMLHKAAGAAANHFATEWEKQAHRPRLRNFTPDNYGAAAGEGELITDLSPYKGKLSLLFVHGTMSTSQNGFHSIPKKKMEQLFKRYDGRVLAFDHPTISVTPTENARWLAKIIGETKMTVDIVSHSRGGLVSRVLAEWPSEAHLAADSLTVRQLIMLGTPNEGTALADSSNLGHFVDRATNLLKIVPDNGFTDALDLILSVVKQLAVGALDGLDGLQSMNPKGDWIKNLNTSRTVAATYHAVASNYEPKPGSPLFRVATDAGIDLVFGKDQNDLVVPKAGVYASDANAAARFPIKDKVVFEAADGVDHSSYWTQKKVLDLFTKVLKP